MVIAINDRPVDDRTAAAALRDAAARLAAAAAAGGGGEPAGLAVSVRRGAAVVRFRFPRPPPLPA